MDLTVKSYVLLLMVPALALLTSGLTYSTYDLVHLFGHCKVDAVDTVVLRGAAIVVNVSFSDLFP